MRSSSSGRTSIKPRWSGSARNGPKYRKGSADSAVPQDRLSRPPALQLDVDAHVGGDERSVPQAGRFQNLAAFLLVRKGEFGPKEPEVDFDARVHADGPDQSGAALEDASDHRGPWPSDSFQEAEADDASFGPLSRTDLRVRIPWVEAVDVHERRGEFRSIRPPFLRIPRHAHPVVPFPLAIPAAPARQDPPF